SCQAVNDAAVVPDLAGARDLLDAFQNHAPYLDRLDLLALQLQRAAELVFTGQSAHQADAGQAELLIYRAELQCVPDFALFFGEIRRVDAVLPSVLVALVGLGGVPAVHAAAAIGHCLCLARMATAGFGSAGGHGLPRRGLHGVFRFRRGCRPIRHDGHSGFQYDRESAMPKYELIYDRNGQQVVESGERPRQASAEDVLFSLLNERKVVLTPMPMPDGGTPNIRQVLGQYGFTGAVIRWLTD